MPTNIPNSTLQPAPHRSELRHGRAYRWLGPALCGLGCLVWLPAAVQAAEAKTAHNSARTVLLNEAATTLRVTSDATADFAILRTNSGSVYGDKDAPTGVWSLLSSC